MDKFTFLSFTTKSPFLQKKNDQCIVNNGTTTHSDPVLLHGYFPLDSHHMPHIACGKSPAGNIQVFYCTVQLNSNLMLMSTRLQVYGKYKTQQQYLQHNKDTDQVK